MKKKTEEKTKTMKVFDLKIIGGTGTYSSSLGIPKEKCFNDLIVKRFVDHGKEDQDSMTSFVKVVESDEFKKLKFTPKTANDYFFMGLQMGFAQGNLERMNDEVRHIINRIGCCF